MGVKGYGWRWSHTTKIFCQSKHNSLLHTVWMPRLLKAGSTSDYIDISEKPLRLVPITELNTSLSTTRSDIVATR
eukprot:SAG31_NODE_2415_length_5732_cov_7.567016_7_plen_75_part_00